MNAKDISYEFYFNTYSGGKEPFLSSDAFIGLRERAFGFVNSYINGKIKDEHKRLVCMAVCETAERMLRLDGALGIKSESTDGYSVTYRDEVYRSILRRTVFDWLGKTGLLYAGVNGC